MEKGLFNALLLDTSSKGCAEQLLTRVVGFSGAAGDLFTGRESFKSWWELPAVLPVFDTTEQRWRGCDIKITDVSKRELRRWSTVLNVQQKCRAMHFSSSFILLV